MENRGCNNISRQEAVDRRLPQVWGKCVHCDKENCDIYYQGLNQNEKFNKKWTMADF